MVLEIKLLYIVKHTNNLNTIIHATRRGKNLEFNPKQITKEGKNILTDNIGLNLIKLHQQKEWNDFEKLKKINLYEQIKNEIADKFKEHNLPFKVRQKEKYLTQYIVSLSPHFWEQYKMIEYKHLIINNQKIKWGIDHIIDKKQLIDVFDSIANSIKMQREQPKINNFVASIIHLDEKTPHMHMFFTNISIEKQKTAITIKHETKYLTMREQIKQNLYQKHQLRIHQKETISHNEWKQNFEKIAKDINDNQLQPLSALKVQEQKIKNWEQEHLFKQTKKDNPNLEDKKTIINTKNINNPKKDHLKNNIKELEKEYGR